MKRSLRTRIAVGLSAYSLLVAIMVIAVGYSMHESQEWMVWRAQLDGEMAAFLQQRAHTPNAVLPRTGKLRTWVARPNTPAMQDVPAELRELELGLHDEIDVEGIEAAVMIRDVGGDRVFMLIDITTLEDEERGIARVLVLLSLLGIGGLVLVVWWLSGRLVKPVAELALAVNALQPGVETGARLQVEARAADEVQAIALAMNQLLDRVDALIEREREFVDTVSHELRTPVAVIEGAAQLAIQAEPLPAAAKAPLQRILQSTAGVSELIHLLLVLAKSPERLRDNEEAFSLDDLLAITVQQHEHLIADKDLRVEVGSLAPGLLHAPPGIVQVAIANLLRNAIENSDRGRILISVQPAGVVRIQDSGHGMSPDEIAKLYVQLVRKGAPGRGQGIGIGLIARICEHLSWKLDLRSTPSEGTLMILDLRRSLAES